MRDERRWTAALAEHETAVSEFIDACGRVPRGDWHRSPAPAKWSPAAVALHVCRAYELGRESAAGGEGMRLRVSSHFARLLRTLVLPVVIATKRFPRGAVAPSELVPDAKEAQRLMPDAAAARLHSVADQAAAALRRARLDRGFTHAYFGPLSPRTTLRLLSAHTRHHARTLK
ncbi:MAG: DinB family protein [Gemmatimonadaceae bacterium]